MKVILIENGIIPDHQKGHGWAFLQKGIDMIAASVKGDPDILIPEVIVVSGEFEGLGGCPDLTIREFLIILDVGELVYDHAPRCTSSKQEADYQQ